MEWEPLVKQLENGERRSATRSEAGVWVADLEVKEGILQAFKDGKLVQEGPFVDKHNLLTQSFSVERGVRVVPGGTAVRRGAYVAKGVIIMPPSYINVGASVDEGTLIDSHVLVGSCAQVGKRVHLSAGVQIGGVLEPVGKAPVVIEDDVFVGAGCIVVEGRVIQKRAVLAPGTILSAGIPVYHCVEERMLSENTPIPEGAVVVPGTRPLGDRHSWGKKMGLSMFCALIVKTRDARTDASIVLEEVLR